MAMRNRIASGALGCILGMAVLGNVTPAVASDAGAFIGGVFATKLIGSMRERNEAEQRQANAAERMAAQHFVLEFCGETVVRTQEHGGQRLDYH